MILKYYDLNFRYKSEIEVNKENMEGKYVDCVYNNFPKKLFYELWSSQRPPPAELNGA